MSKRKRKSAEQAPPPKEHSPEQVKEIGRGMLSISKEQALAVFHQQYPPATVHWVEITDTLPAGCAVYDCPRDCWFVRFLTVYDEPYILRSSRLVAVSQTTGEILFDGSANDEG